MVLQTSCRHLRRFWQHDQAFRTGLGTAQGPQGKASFCTAGAAISETDAVVVGAGVVGLACARALALAGHEVILLEQHSTFGTETSSRHSEVIHAGIYYPKGSLKAELCVQGKHMLYDYCKSKEIPHNNITKLIVATNEQQAPQLEQLRQAGISNGVSDLQVLSGAEARSLEPALAAARALLSPSTGIIDSHSYMEALLSDAEAAGAMLAVNSEVQGLTPGQGGRQVLEVRDTVTGELSSLAARIVVNAAGLHAQALSRRTASLPSSTIPAQYLAKGHYFTLTGRNPFSRLIYPLPEPGLKGLGVHLTLDLAGQAKFGPDVRWVNSIDYTMDPARAEGFYPAIRSYYPGLEDGSLSPSYTGIRPKVSGPGEAAGDFVVQGRGAHGVKGLVCLYGVESPGLTSSMAIGDYVVKLLQQER